jgi:F420H(2)-dependent quinone reductase
MGAVILRRFMRLISGSSTALRSFIRAISALHMFVYRLTGGAISGQLGLPNARFILLITKGRKTGRQRAIPLLSISDGEDLVVIASHGGLDQAPAWWLNLKANPEAHVRIGRNTIKVRAVEADHEERNRLWPRFLREYPGYEDYRNRTSRQIPIVILHQVEDASGGLS